jgi:hypothetical protein
MNFFGIKQEDYGGYYKLDVKWDFFINILWDSTKIIKVFN